MRQVAYNSVRDLRCHLQTPGLHCLPIHPTCPIRLRWFPCQNRQGSVGMKRRLQGEPLAARTAVTFVHSVYPSFVSGEHPKQTMKNEAIAQSIRLLAYQHLRRVVRLLRPIAKTEMLASPTPYTGLLCQQVMLQWHFANYSKIKDKDKYVHS